MELKIEITAEQIDEMIRNRLVEAAVGQAITSQIKQSLRLDSYDSPIKRGVDQAINAAVIDVLEMPHHKETIRTAVDAVITKDVLAKVAADSASKLMRREY
jgi:hypothetical protein